MTPFENFCNHFVALQEEFNAKNWEKFGKVNEAFTKTFGTLNTEMMTKEEVLKLQNISVQYKEFLLALSEEKAVIQKKINKTKVAIANWDKIEKSYGRN